MPTEILSDVLPDKRYNCPSVRPCPYVSCIYNTFLEVDTMSKTPRVILRQKDDAGNIIEDPLLVDPNNSCVLDIVDRNLRSSKPTMTNEQVAEVLGISRETVRLCYYGALKKLEHTFNEDIIPEWEEGDFASFDEICIDFNITPWTLNKWTNMGLLYKEEEGILYFGINDIVYFFKQNISEHKTIRNCSQFVLAYYKLKDLN